MTLLHFDGHRSYADLADYDATLHENLAGQSHSGTQWLWGTGYSRFGSPDRGARGTYNLAPLRFELNSSLSPSTIIFGIVFYKQSTGVPYVNTSYPLIKMKDTADGGTHINICLNSSYNFAVYRDTTLLGTSSGKTVINQTWHHLEAKVYFHDSNGTIELKLDGTTILSLTSQDTLTGSNAYARHFEVRCIHSSMETHFDLWYLCDNAGSAPQNDFLGDCRCDIIRPNGAGNQSDFTPLAGSNYENVDEITPDDDTTYNSSGTVNDQDSYALPSLDSVGTIYGTKNSICIKKDDAGTKNAKILTRSNITFYKSNEIFPATTYVTYGKIYQDNPDDSLAWELADIAGMEVGVEVSS